MDEHIYTVYVHIDPEGKRYYGSTQQDPKKRWLCGHGYPNNKYFTDAINKFGWSNFQHIIIAKGLTKEEAFWLEIELINTWNTTNPNNGYNRTKGGYGTNGWNPSEETRKKMSDAKVGKYTGKNHSKTKPVICLTTKRIFHTIEDGAKCYGVISSNIIKCCKGKHKSSGKLNGQKLVWRYLVWKHDKKFRIIGNIFKLM